LDDGAEVDANSARDFGVILSWKSPLRTRSIEPFVRAQKYIYLNITHSVCFFTGFPVS
jgi:hypothetical protein